MKPSWEKSALILDLWLDGVSQAEMARKLGCSRQTIRRHLRRAARQLAHRVFYGVKPYLRCGGTGAYEAVFKDYTGDWYGTSHITQG